MSTTTSPAPAAPAAETRRDRRRHTRIVAGSLGFGAVTALALVALAFPGASEPVTAGAILLGLGAGWAMLAFLFARVARQPQPWAWVPATTLAATGAALMAFAPSDEAMTRLSWAWPALLLALVAWTAREAWRHLGAAARWATLPMLAVLGLAALGGGVHAATTAPVPEAPGTLYAVGDHRLHLDCRGSGAPTVLLFNGTGESSASWSGVAGALATDTRVCAFDRAGQAWSEDVTVQQDAEAAARDLHALLDAAGEHGPYVLAGHSMGGPYALAYTARHPEDVVGVALLDSTSPHQFEDVPAYPLQYQVMRRVFAVAPTLARIGLGAAIAPVSDLPGEAGDLVDRVGASGRTQVNARAEVEVIPAVLAQARELRTLGSRPLVVVTATGSLSTEGWDAAQARLAALSTDSVHQQVDVSHAGVVDAPEGVRASADAIAAVIAAVRTGESVATS